MEQLAAILRSLQLFAHNAHNMAKGASFFADHKFLGQVYPEYESAYDSVVERAIGLDMQMDLSTVTRMAAEGSSVMSLEAPFMSLLEGEQLVCESIESILQTPVTEGTKQLLGEICNQSESRQYKIKQRIK